MWSTAYVTDVGIKWNDYGDNGEIKSDWKPIFKYVCKYSRTRLSRTAMFLIICPTWTIIRLGRVLVDESRFLHTIDMYAYLQILVQYIMYYTYIKHCSLSFSCYLRVCPQNTWHTNDARSKKEDTMWISILQNYCRTKWSKYGKKIEFVQQLHVDN